MTRIVALDTETTSLRWDRRIWEAGYIIREETGQQWERRLFVDRADLDLGNADPFSLNIGGFYDRHPQAQLDWADEGDDLFTEREVLAAIEPHVRGAHIIGNVVNFDTDVLATRMRAHGLLWNAHYHLIDVEALAVGYLARQADELHAAGLPAKELLDVIAPPWNSEELSAALGVEVPGEDRHTALGDARWALAMYDKVMGIR